MNGMLGKRKEKLKLMLGWIKDNRVFLTLLCFAIAVSILYLMMSTVNVPFMDYYGVFVNICENTMNGELTWSDFWNTHAQHKNPIWTLFLVMNIKYFHWNTLVFTYLGLVFQSIGAFVLYGVYKKLVRIENQTLMQLAFAPFLLVQFSTLQWELTTNEYSAAFTLRILLFLISMIGIDRYLHDRKRPCLLRPMVYGFLVGSLFVLIGQMYFLGVYVAILSAILFAGVECWKRNRLKYAVQDILIIVLITAGVLFYFHGVDLRHETGHVNQEYGTIQIILEQILDGTMLKGFAVLLGSSLFQRDQMTDFAFIVGIIYLSVILILVAVYFIKGFHKTTYLPIMLLIYVFVNMAMFVYARIDRFGMDGLCSSRYIMETKLATFAVFMIIAMILGNDRHRVSMKRVSMFSVAFCIAVCLILFVSNGLEIGGARWRKAYHRRAVESLLHVNELEDHELHINQAQNAEQFRKAAALMEKYELGCFYDKRAFK